MSWADEIAALAHRTFNSLALQITEFISGRKVLAAIIMKREPPQGQEEEPWMADQVGVAYWVKGQLYIDSGK